MGEIRDWLFTLVSHWQYWASGGGLGGLVVLLANMIERFKAKSMSNTSYILIFIVCFLVGASFMAWRDEHIKVLASEKERPSLAFPSAEIKPIPDQQGNVAELRLNIGFMNDGKQTLVHTRGRMIATDSSLNSPQ